MKKTMRRRRSSSRMISSRLRRQRRRLRRRRKKARRSQVDCLDCFANPRRRHLLRHLPLLWRQHIRRRTLRSQYSRRRRRLLSRRRRNEKWLGLTSCLWERTQWIGTSRRSTLMWWALTSTYWRSWVTSRQGMQCSVGSARLPSISTLSF